MNESFNRIFLISNANFLREKDIHALCIQPDDLIILFNDARPLDLLPPAPQKILILREYPYGFWAEALFRRNKSRFVKIIGIAKNALKKDYFETLMKAEKTQGEYIMIPEILEQAGLSYSQAHPAYLSSGFVAFLYTQIHFNGAIHLVGFTGTRSLDGRARKDHAFYFEQKHYRKLLKEKKIALAASGTVDLIRSRKNILTTGIALALSPLLAPFGSPGRMSANFPDKLKVLIDQFTASKLRPPEGASVFHWTRGGGVGTELLRKKGFHATSRALSPCPFKSLRRNAEGADPKKLPYFVCLDELHLFPSFALAGVLYNIRAASRQRRGGFITIPTIKTENALHRPAYWWLERIRLFFGLIDFDITPEAVEITVAP